MKLFLKVLIGLFIAFVLFGGGAMFYLTRGLEAGNQVSINELNLSTLSDGTYNGQYDAGRWSNEVNVTIKDHKIIKIDVVKDVSLAKPEVTEAIISRVIEKQNTKVEAVSGATVTSKAYLKAMENALKK